MLTPVLQSSGPFATVLTDVSQDTGGGDQEHRLRAREACDRLAEQGADADVVKAVAERLEEVVHRPAPVARLVVATPEGVAYDEVATARVDHPVATWDRLPDLGAWVQHRDAAVRFVLALVDHEGGDVTVHDTDVPEPEVEVSAGGEVAYVHHVPTGGWAMLKLQHTNENVWKRNADAVVDEVAGLVRGGERLVLLAGDPRSVSMVREGLEGLPAKVVQLATGTRAEDGGEEALQEAIREAVLAEVVSRRTALVHRLHEGLGRGDTAVSGVREVADAFVRGQVETLLIDPAEAANQELDPTEHPGLVLGGAAVSGPVRADEALIAAAVATSADVAPAPSAALKGAPAAAILRWEQ